MATAVTLVEPTGSRRAVKSEKFMEWQRELSSSRAIHGSRRRHEESDMEATGMKKSFPKSEEHGARPQSERESEERDVDGEEPIVDFVGAEEVKRKKRQRSEVKKSCKENEVDQKKVANTQSKEKSPPSAEGDGGRMRRCKQPGPQPGPVSHPKRQLMPLASPQQQPEATLTQPISTRRQRRLPRSTTPKEEKDIERVLRSLTRNRGGETPPQAPAVPAGKGTKRSKRVAQRLANEDPPPARLKMPKLTLCLTKKEIQEDFLAITGQKYIGKPKKSTIVQRGLGLCTALTTPSAVRYLTEPQCVLVY